MNEKTLRDSKKFPILSCLLKTSSSNRIVELLGVFLYGIAVQGLMGMNLISTCSRYRLVFSDIASTESNS